MKESLIVGVIRLAFVLAFVFFAHAFIIADIQIFEWHWIARLSFVILSLLVFSTLYIVDKKQKNG